MIYLEKYRQVYTRIPARQTIEDMTKISISAPQQQRAISRLHRFPSSKLNKTLTEFIKNFVYLICHFHFQIPCVLKTSRKSSEDAKYQLYRPTERRPNLCFEWRSSLERQLCKERFSPSVVYWIRRGAKLSFATKAITYEVVTLTSQGYRNAEQRPGKAKANQGYVSSRLKSFGKKI